MDKAIKDYSKNKIRFSTIQESNFKIILCLDSRLHGNDNFSGTSYASIGEHSFKLKTMKLNQIRFVILVA